MKSKGLFFLCFFLLSIFSGASQTHKVHSHNDYEQDIPFWKALSAGVSSLEADVFLRDGQLMVAHEAENLQADRTLERLYLKPLAETLQLGFLSDKSLQLLIDIKSEAYTTLDAVVGLLKEYPMITGNNKISIVISGNRPKTSAYVNYPDFISFDYQSLEPVEDLKALDKIELISLSFRKFSRWDGKGKLPDDDLERIMAVVRTAHAMGKPFRFWATPDSKMAWQALVDMGVDYVNTDHPIECVQYVNSLPK